MDSNVVVTEDSPHVALWQWLLGFLVGPFVSLFVLAFLNAVFDIEGIKKSCRARRVSFQPKFTSTKISAAYLLLGPAETKPSQQMADKIYFLVAFQHSHHGVKAGLPRCLRLPDNPEAGRVWFGPLRGGSFAPIMARRHLVWLHFGVAAFHLCLAGCVGTP